MSGLEKNFQGMFFQDRVIMCPYCQIKFATVPQLINHKKSYCTTEENYELLEEMFAHYAEDIERNGENAMVNQKNITMMNGLYLLKAEWDLFLNYLENPKEALLADQEKKKKIEGNTRKPHFEAMFSDFNVDAENLQSYPFVEGYLENNYGEDLTNFGFIGEATNADDGLKKVPDWLKGTKIGQEENQKALVAKNYIDDITRQDLKSIKNKNFSKMSSEQLFRDNDYMKILNVMRNDTNMDLGANDINFFLNKPAVDWEAAFFDSQRNPSKEEIEDILLETERPEARKNAYTNIMNDLWIIYEAMSNSLLTKVDLDKRDKVVKLIAERELLYRRETKWLQKMPDFKQLYFKKMDREYIALPVPPKVQRAFMNLFLKLRYLK